MNGHFNASSDLLSKKNLAISNIWYWKGCFDIPVIRLLFICITIWVVVYVQKDVPLHHLKAVIFACLLKYFSCTFFQKCKLFLKETSNYKFCCKSWLTELNYYVADFPAFKINYYLPSTTQSIAFWQRHCFQFNSCFRLCKFRNYSTVQDRINFWNGTYLTLMQYIETPKKIPERHLHWQCQIK